MEKINIPPDYSGFSSEDTTGLLYVALDGGRGRQRLDILNGSKTSPVSWRTDQAGWNYLRNFNRENVARNCEPFLIDLYDELGTVEERAASFVPNSFALTGNNGIEFSVKATIEVYDPDLGVPPIFPLLFLYDFEDNLAITGPGPTDHGGRTTVVATQNDGTPWGGDPAIEGGDVKFGTQIIFNSNNGFSLHDTAGAFSFGTGNFQIDWWNRCSNSYNFFDREVFAIVGALRISMPGGPEGSLAEIRGAGDALITTSSVRQIDNVYYHMCIQRKNGVLRCWSNGVKFMEVADIREYPENAAIRFLYGYNGSLDEIRGSRNAADFFVGDTFAPPTAPYARIV